MVCSVMALDEALPRRVVLEVGQCLTPGGKNDRTPLQECLKGNRPSSHVYEYGNSRPERLTR